MYIVSSVTAIGNGAFWDCNNLKSVYYTGDVFGWCSITFGGFFSNPLCFAHDLYINNELITELVIPNTVTKINAHAFDGISATSVTIPDGVTNIETNAFSGCRKLTSITIPNSVTTIGESAFVNCSSLISNITIPNRVTTIEKYAFANCISLTNITIPDSVTTIGALAFNRCNNAIIKCRVDKKPDGWDKDFAPKNLFGKYKNVVWGYKGE